MRHGIVWLALMIFAGAFSASALDNAQFVSMSLPTNAQVMPRTVFSQTWKIKNTGTTIWLATQNGYKLCLSGWDTLGALPTYTNASGDWYIPSAIIGSGSSVSPAGQTTFTMNFIAPEAPGTYVDSFQMTDTNGNFFGPQFIVEVTVIKAGSTNQFDRSRAVSYANNYAGYICSDGYFWVNGSSYQQFGTNVPTPTYLIGDDCAHFVSSCIGSQALQRGAGLSIPSRVPPTYGEPGASRLVNTVLIAPGYAREVFSLDQMEPGDVFGWNWEGDTNISNLDHVTLYLGQGMTASHAVSALDVSADTFFQGGSTTCVRHMIHIFDAPTVNVGCSGTNIVLSWTTNWAGYTLYSSPSLGADAAWSPVTGKPKAVGGMNILSNAMGPAPAYYRLVMH
jgi:hypothetical protein